MTDPQRELADALEAVAVRERVAARVVRAERSLEEASAASLAAQADLGREAADVAALESFSPARIWATLRGELATRLSAEQAEQQAAEYAVARAESAVARSRGELDAARTALADLGDVDRRLGRALRGEERRLRDAGGPVGEELESNARTLGSARAELVEAQQAVEAATTALEILEQASQMLHRAKDWSTYDTFFGGGLFASAMKYDRVEDAEELLRTADAALKRLAVELADVGGLDTPRLEVTRMTRTFDVWFDDLFTDWSVRGRINRVHENTIEVMRRVVRIRLRLRARIGELDHLVESALERRTELLVPR